MNKSSVNTILLICSVVLICPLILAVSGCKKPHRGSMVNFGHLQHLTERVELSGDSVSIIHIYANYPEYAWVDAKESGPEGIACVDDAARGAVLYLRDYELNNRSESLVQAKDLLDFVLAMQAPDGEFWNFIHADHSINRDGRTSFKSFGWWAARGIWALGTGYRVFQKQDTLYAARLRSAVERSLPHLRVLLQNYGTMESEGGFSIPTWLLYGSGADATSELALGLIEYYRAVPSEELREMITRLGAGFMAMQEGDLATFPHGLHRSWRTQWHLWGNGQTEALAAAGKFLGDSVMISSARREAEGFYPRLLTGGLLREMDLTNPAGRATYDQIAYGIRPMAVGLLRLYDATGNQEYLRMAGLTASWFFGNNPAGAVMYDSASGRGYDGIRSSTEINRNSGAESTIEALMTLVELERYPEALRYLHYTRGNSDSLHASFTAPAGEKITLRLDPGRNRFLFE